MELVGEYLKVINDNIIAVIIIIVVVLLIGQGIIELFKLLYNKLKN